MDSSVDEDLKKEAIEILRILKGFEKKLKKFIGQ
jgi:hypothetical protein